MIERFHSTLIEHIRFINNQETYSAEPIDIKVNYTLLAYNNTTHSATKLKPVEIVNGHLNTNSPLDLELSKQILNNYITKHRDKIELLYGKVNERNQKQKEKVILKLNEKSIDFPDIPQKVFVKNKQNQLKTKN